MSQESILRGIISAGLHEHEKERPWLRWGDNVDKDATENPVVIEKPEPDRRAMTMLYDSKSSAWNDAILRPIVEALFKNIPKTIFSNKQIIF